MGDIPKSDLWNYVSGDREKNPVVIAETVNKPLEPLKNNIQTVRQSWNPKTKRKPGWYIGWSVIEFP